MLCWSIPVTNWNPAELKGSILAGEIKGPAYEGLAQGLMSQALVKTKPDHQHQRRQALRPDSKLDNFIKNVVVSHHAFMKRRLGSVAERDYAKWEEKMKKRQKVSLTKLRTQLEDVFSFEPMPREGQGRGLGVQNDLIDMSGDTD
jgi:hypothetical protein